MNAQSETLEKLHAQKVEQYFAMRKQLTTADDETRRALEKASGKLFTETVEMGARLYPSQHHSND
jgi:ABC-type long-subunit fatty acid transport system fused permease/ATPase subunit